MATIRKRGETFQVQIRRQGHRTLTKSFQDVLTARQWARKTESEVEREVYLDSSIAQQTTLQEVLERYSKDILPRKRAGKSEEPRIRLLKTRLGHHTLFGLKSHLVAQYRDERLKVVKPSTVKRELGLLSRVLNTANKEWGIMLPIGNVVQQIRSPSEPHGRDRRLQPGEEQILLDSMKHTPTARSIVEFALETAMRREEITSTDWRHLNISKRTLYIPKTKTDFPRTIPLSPRAIEILKRAQGDATSIHGRIWRITPYSVSQAFRRACGRAKIENLHFHDLRHEATSRLFEKGLSLMEVAAITGHKDLRMLQRYTHLRAEDLAKKLG